MAGVTRVAVSLEPELLEQFDALVADHGYATRSEAVRDLIRAKLVEEKLRQSASASVGAVCLIYDHEQSGLPHKLTHLQHTSHEQIISTLHVHLDAHNCLEILVVRGTGKAVRQIGDRLIATKGVKHGQLVMTTTGKGL